jgi:hypothetical protein
MAHALSIAAQSNDFATRCTAVGVLKCVSFDTDADFGRGAGGSQGAWGSRSGYIPPRGTSDYSRVIRDTAQSADGPSSLRFTIPSRSGADVAGVWFTNFTDDLSYQVGEGQEVFVQWRQRFSPELLNTRYAKIGGGLANGWKLVDISAGDTLGCSYRNANSTVCPTTCWDFEVVLQNTYQANVPQMYTNCAGPFPYAPLLGATSNVTVQNAIECLYPDYSDPPCMKFYADEWMTFQIHIKVGSWNQWNSTVQLWVARDGTPSQLVVDCSPTALKPCNNRGDNVARNGWYLYNADSRYRIGKVWLMPYHTNKDPKQVAAAAYTWYDDLIISTTKIADPSAAQNSIR